MSTGTKKGAQYHSSLGKCKSKPEWDISWLLINGYHLKKKKTRDKGWEGFGEKGILIHCWWECKLVHTLWKTV